MWGVLEHLTEPTQKLLELKTLLNENGIIALTTININGTIPYQLKPPEHTLYFSLLSLELLAKNAGLKIISIEKFNTLASTNYKNVKELMYLPPSFDEELQVRSKILKSAFNLSTILILDEIIDAKYEIELNAETYDDVREELV